MRIFFAVFVADIIPLFFFSIIDYLLLRIIPYHVVKNYKKRCERRGVKVKWINNKGLPPWKRLPLWLIGSFITLMLIDFLIPLLMLLFTFNLMSAHLSTPALHTWSDVLNMIAILVGTPWAIYLLIRGIGHILIFHLCWRGIINSGRRKAEARGDINLDSIEERLNNDYHRFLRSIASGNAAMVLFTLLIYFYYPGWLLIFKF